MVLASLTSSQVRLVQKKVEYSEVDSSFNSYLDVLNKVTKLSNTLLHGELPETDTENADFQFSTKYVSELEQSLELRYLELQNSLETKKVAYENWEQSNESIIEEMAIHVETELPVLTESRNKLHQRTSRLRDLYSSVNMINRESELLSIGKTHLTATHSEWDTELGLELTSKLISIKYLKVHGVENNDPEDKYRVYDNFSKGPKELKSVNKSMRTDIRKLSSELSSYKEKWVKDADIFTKLSNVLNEEFIKRDMELGTNGGDEEDDEEEVDEARSRYVRNRKMEEEMIDDKQEGDNPNENISFEEEEGEEREEDDVDMEDKQQLEQEQEVVDEEDAVKKEDAVEHTIGVHDGTNEFDKALDEEEHFDGNAEQFQESMSEQAELDISQRDFSLESNAVNESEDIEMSDEIE